MTIGLAISASVDCGSSSSLNCSVGMHEENGSCIADLICGPGTTRIGNVCFADGTTSDGGAGSAGLSNRLDTPAST
jgi:hypothetical protein